MVSSGVRKIVIRLAISSDEFLKLYQGLARDVKVRSTEGLNVRFPANSLKPFMAHNGVHGTFCLEIDQNNKLVNLSRIAS